MIFRFIKPWEEACKDYLVRLYYIGSYEKIRITRKEGF